MNRSRQLHRHRLRFLIDASTAMSFRPPYIGGENRPRRFFSSERINSGAGSETSHGGGYSHFRPVREPNLDFRHGNSESFSHNSAFHRSSPHWRPRQDFRPKQQYNYTNQNYHRPPDYRTWESAKEVPFSSRAERFTVLSYNILADYLALDHRDTLYYHIPPYMLDWQWRKSKLISEIGLWSADIMCLQEVDRFQDFEEELCRRGYSGIWKMRTGIPVDGCAIFWRASRFKLMYEESIEFNEFGLRDNVAQICVFELKNHNRGVNAASPLTGSAGSNKVVICNVHVLYNPKRGDIKLAQVRRLLHRAHAVSQIWDGAPLVLCGDFNCVPESPLYNYISEQTLDLSGISRYNVSGQASAEIQTQRTHFARARSGENVPSMDAQKLNNSDSNHNNVPLANFSEPDSINAVNSYNISSPDTKLKDDEAKLDVVKEKTKRSSEDNVTDTSSPACSVPSWAPWELETATGDANRTSLEHPLKLKSTYAEAKDTLRIRGPNGEPLVTSYHKRFMGTVDYIWRSEGLQTLGVLAPIPKYFMHRFSGFPTKKWGSDHIALVTELTFAKNETKS